MFVLPGPPVCKPKAIGQGIANLSLSLSLPLPLPLRLPLPLPLPLKEDFSHYQKLWDSPDYREKVDKSDTKSFVGGVSDVVSFCKKW